MRVLLTGATGLIGSAIAARLRAEVFTVITVGRGGHADCRLDLADAAAASDPLPPADALVHAAGVIDEDFRVDPLAAYRKAVSGTQRLLAAAQRAGARRFVYLSSAHVYGPLAGRIDERSPRRPQNDYANCHAAAEAMFARAAREAPAGQCVLLRPCAVYGPLDATRSFGRWSLIPFDFPRMAAQGRIALQSSGLQVRAFVSTPYIAQRVLHWLREDAPEVVDNVVTRDSMSVLEFAHLTARVAQGALGRPVEVAVPAAAVPPAEAPLDYASLWGAAEDPYPLATHVQNLIDSLRGSHAIQSA